MIRFLPDTWRDAVMRPIAMAAPDGGVYAEIMAPDLRFAAIMVLVAVLACLWLTGRSRRWGSPLLPLLLWTVAAFAVWLATTGNGRYFIPVLLLAGPLCIALVYRLPGTAAFRLAAAGLIVALQGIALYNNDPRGSWGLAPWSDHGFFQVSLDEEARTQPATYVTITNISYSLIAPRFHPQSRWMNISSLPDASVPSPDVLRAKKLLDASTSVKLLIPVVPDYMTAQREPTEALRTTINSMLGAQRLALARSSDCRFQPSLGLASEAVRDLKGAKPETLAKFGFWICPLQYPVVVEAKPEVTVDDAVRRALEAVENRCPRFFAPGQSGAARLEGGWLRVYPQADIKLYVLDDGQIFYKYWRALNPMLIGKVADVVRSDFTMDCNAIRGRSGLPWEREI